MDIRDATNVYDVSTVDSISVPPYVNPYARVLEKYPIILTRVGFGILSEARTYPYLDRLCPLCFGPPLLSLRTTFQRYPSQPAHILVETCPHSFDDD